MADYSGFWFFKVSNQGTRLTLSWRRFLYGRDLNHERVKRRLFAIVGLGKNELKFESITILEYEAKFVGNP